MSYCAGGLWFDDFKKIRKIVSRDLYDLFKEIREDSKIWHTVGVSFK